MSLEIAVIGKTCVNEPLIRTVIPSLQTLLRPFLACVSKAPPSACWVGDRRADDTITPQTPVLTAPGKVS